MPKDDLHAKLAAMKAEHQPEPWESDAFEYSDAGIGCLGCECAECGNIGSFDGPCPTSALVDALTAVLDLHMPMKYGECYECADGVPYPCPTAQAITEKLEGLACP